MSESISPPANPSALALVPSSPKKRSTVRHTRRLERLGQAWRVTVRTMAREEARTELARLRSRLGRGAWVPPPAGEGSGQHRGAN